MFPRPLLSFLPVKEAAFPRPLAHPRQNSQASGIPPNSPLAIAHLPPSERSNSPPATAHLPSGEGSSSSQAIPQLPSGEGSSIPQATISPQAGQFNNPTRSVRQHHRCSPRHKAPQVFPGE